MPTSRAAGPAAALPIGRPVTIEDRYSLEEGRVLLTGVQGLVRLVFDQMRADRRGGLRTGALVSGYQGSPLGGLDRELLGQAALAGELEVVFRPGLNEDLGATAVWGSQLVTTLPRARVDGVLGMWYGKAPGVDRSGDALRHGNFVGAHPRGGMIAVCGDDPSCKSSTIPSESESTLAALRMPVVAPGNPQEVLDLGRHAIAASRASGLWTGLKVVTNVADAVASVEVGPERVRPLPVVVEDRGRPYVHIPNADLIATATLEMERTMVGPRMALARAYARENRLDRIVLDPPRPWLGIAAAGATYYDLREALHTLGLGDDQLRRLGVRLLKIGMLWPLEPGIVRAHARGLEELLVVEDKGPFLETAIREILFDAAERPRVLGKEDERGAPLLPASGMLDIDTIARAVGTRLLRKGAIASVAARLEALDRPAPEPVPGNGARLPFFCSGCPHNRSTDAPDDAVVGAGIGCHGMVVISPAGKGQVTGATQMGGEGAQWIGQQPFTDTPHVFQNLGDGTFHHSGSLAVRASIAAGVNVTYKLLYNSAVAMTGGQDVEGAMPVPDLTRWLAAEGVRRIVVTTDEPARYRGVELSPIAEVRPRAKLMEAQRELAGEPGVTVLIHDQGCAAEQRRLRKRGKLPDPPERIFINERVCEGCGDCGEKSHCLSLLPVDTEFGRKTRIDQASCNKDYSCAEGDCPSFLTVIPGKRASHEPPAPPADLPLPALRAGEEATIRMVGIGGTGVVTVAQVLAMAAMLDGKRALGLDQTGLAQKGGQVISDVRVLPEGEDRGNRASRDSVDCYLGFDLIGASLPSNLVTAEAGRTVAVVSTSAVPTGDAVGDPTARFVDVNASLDAIELVSRPDANVYLDAQELADALFRDKLPANVLLLGAAWQRGLIPISLDAILEAFRLNGAGVERNVAAFQWGRAVVARPDAVAEVSQPAAVTERRLSRAERALVETVGAETGSELERLLEVRIGELAAYQSIRYARRYAELVRAVVEAERATGRSHGAAEAVARELYRLMAYKDEYEVARLHLDPEERRRLADAFGAGARIRYQLHPPVLRALGMERKLTLGRWFDPAFRLLRRTRFLRGTALDPFGYARVRRVERSLVDEYRHLVTRALPHLAEAPDRVVELCELPSIVRGYEHVKLRNVETFRARAGEIGW
ncbi:MAG TPA: indolepyruvate ferredoxin oxidoreductase family protein, partial [Solirubrobacteraceae bacterium]|nr:indolepyruvate ferredoxin oxidoreductase family protein [Solirubrobacteraceae bacterium]